MASMTLRHAKDGWHYGVETDAVDVDNAGGLVEGDLGSAVDGLIAEYAVTVVDVREDFPSPDGEVAVIVSRIGRKARSVLTSEV